MTDVSEIISSTTHRPYKLPTGSWRYYQEWNKALFLHWKVSYDELRKIVPNDLEIDSFKGDYYISLVAFTMEKIRPKYFPSISVISDFDEINLRTYINNDDKAGVYFLNIEAGKSLSSFVARLLSGLPYEKAKIRRSDKKYISKNLSKGFHFDTEFIINDKLPNKSELDKWLTERYCLFLESNNERYRYDIHHKEWEIKAVETKKLNLYYKVGDIVLSEVPPDLTHYSDGVKVLAWQRKKL